MQMYNFRADKISCISILQTYSEKLAMHTDGFITHDGRASCSFQAPSMAYDESYRLSGYTSIHAAEMLAINRALEWATSVEHDELVLYTAGVLQAIEQRQS